MNVAPSSHADWALHGGASTRGDFAGGQAPPAVDISVDPVATGVVDDEHELQRCTRWVTDEQGTRMAETHLRLSGVTCAACALPIEEALRGVDGVSHASVFASIERAVVRWEPQRTRLSSLLTAIRQAGYGAAPDASADARELRKQEARTALWRWFVAALCGMQVMMLLTPSYVSAPGELDAEMKRLLNWGAWTLTVPVMAFSAWPYFVGAWQGIVQRRIGMDVPIAVALIVTFVASTGSMVDPDGIFGPDVYFESITMFVTFLLGARWLETRVRHKAAVWLEDAVVQLPEVAHRIVADGSIEHVAAHRLRAGDTISVPQGEAFPADGELLDGPTQADEAMLTGESHPVDKQVGDEVVGGSINLAAPVKVRVTAAGCDTRQQAMVDLVRDAMSQRPASARWADRWAAPFLWVVLALALASAVVWSFIDPARAIWVAVAVLIVTCPCALSLAVPSALLAATGNLARRGVLMRRVSAIEDMARVDTVMFDKTGTITQESSRAVRLQSADREEMSTPAQAQSALHAAAALASQSSHPVSRLVVGAARHLARSEVMRGAWTEVQEVPGKGLQGLAQDGKAWRLGSWAWVAEADGSLSDEADPSVRAWFGPVGSPRWMVVETDGQGRLRPRVADMVRRLKDRGVRVALISGDSEARVQAAAQSLQVDHFMAHATPQAKLKAVAEAQRNGHVVATVGDGVNDAPVMAKADVSLAMGHGALVTRHHADAVILRDDPVVVEQALDLAGRTTRVIRQNLVWSALYNLACVPLAMAGLLPPWLAGLGMALSSLVVILNANRLAR